MFFSKNRKALRLSKDQPHIFGLIADNQIESLKLLIVDKTQTKIKNDTGQTPLIFACEIGTLAAVELLLPLCENMHLEDFNGCTALMVASKYDQNDCLKMLLEHKVDPNYANIAGRTALMLASARAAESAVNSLIEFGCNVNMNDKQGCDALYYVKNGRDSHIFTMAKRARIKKLLKKRSNHNKRNNYRTRAQPKIKTKITFAELVGRHGKGYVSHFFGSFVAIYMVTSIVGLLPFRILAPNTSENLNYAIPLIIPIASFLYSLTYLGAAWQIARYTPSTEYKVSDIELSSDILNQGSFSQTEYIQTLMDFRFKELTNTFSDIVDLKIIKWSKAILIIALLLGGLLITNLFMWFLVGSPDTPEFPYLYASDLAWTAFFISLVGAWLESKRRQKSLLRMHYLFDKKANLLLENEPIDNTDFVLYLRAFESTGALNIGGRDFETTISQFLMDKIMLVTFGVPGEYTGAARIQSTDTHWQGNVLKLMHQAKHILMLPSDRPGTVWEAEQLKVHNFLSKTSFIMPPELLHKKEAYSYVWARAFNVFRTVGLNIPKHTKKGLVFTLTPSGYLHEFSLLQEASMFVKMHGANVGSEGVDDDADGVDGEGGDGGGDG